MPDSAMPIVYKHNRSFEIMHVVWTLIVIIKETYINGDLFLAKLSLGLRNDKWLHLQWGDMAAFCIDQD